MKNFRLVAALLSAAFLAACGAAGALLSPSEPGLAQIKFPQCNVNLNGRFEKWARPSYGSPANARELYAFNGLVGAYPEASLLYVNGALYGTTAQGGKGTVGAIFKMTPSGSLSIIHNFFRSHGANPVGRLTDVNGTLFGTTQNGGTHNCGTVFKITTSGSATVIYSFKGGTDGAWPMAHLIAVNGNLYGTTYLGGYGNGTVFEITASGVEHVLHKFGDAYHDGVGPFAGMTEVNGVLYGTARNGGDANDGTVFRITLSGEEKTIHSFSGSDGYQPYASLAYVDGALYGTTSGGGAGCSATVGCGDVFKMTTSGKETVLHNFDGKDGFNPVSGLAYRNGSFYGTTVNGGRYGSGTVFKITALGKETVLHSFRGRGGQDAANPYGGVTFANGALYGTTRNGGPSNDGTVYKLSP